MLTGKSAIPSWQVSVGISFENYHYREGEMTMLTATLPFSFSGLCFRLYANLDITHWIKAKPIRSSGSTWQVVSLLFLCLLKLSKFKHKQHLALQHVHSFLHSRAFALLQPSYWAWRTAGSNQAHIFGAWHWVMLKATVALDWPRSEPVPRISPKTC